MSAASHAITTGVLAMAGDTHIKSDIPTTNNGTQMVIGMQKTGAFLRRTLLKVTHGITGAVKVNSASLDLTGWNGDIIDGYINRLLRDGWVELEGTWNKWASGGGETDWTTAGADDDGTDHTTTNRVSFTSDPSGSKEVDIADLVQDCLDAGKPTIDLLVLLQDEAGFNASTLWRSREYTTEADRPTLTINYTPEPYGTWLEADELIALPNNTSAKVICQMGSRLFAANDRLRAAYSTDPTMATGLLYTAEVDVDTASAGDWVNLNLTDLTADTRYYYRVQAAQDTGSSSSSGITGWASYFCEGDIRTFRTQPAADSTIMMTLTSDDHWTDKWAKRGTSSHLQVAVDVDQLVNGNVGAEVDARGEPPSLHLNGGDGIIYGASNLTIYPLETDGSGESIGGFKIAQSLADCTEQIRAARNNRTFRYHSIPYMEGASNHKPSHWFHYSANEPGNVNAAAWANTAVQNGLGIPAAAGGVYRGQETYGAFDWGPLLVCFVDPFLDSYPAVTTPAPIQMDSLDDWVLSTAQRDFFFGELATTKRPWVVLMCHNLLGGRGADGAIPYYGRGGINYVLADGTYWADTFHPALVNYKAANPSIEGIIVVLGHDHCHQFGKVNGINYCHLATPGDGPGGPTESAYGDGFAGALTGNYLGNFSPNAGHYRLDASPTSFRLQYKRGFFATESSSSAWEGKGDAEPSDGIVTNNAIVDTLLLTVPTVELPTPDEPAAVQVEPPERVATLPMIAGGIRDYAGRTIDLFFMYGAQEGGGMREITPSLGWDSGGQIITGVQKAAQFFVTVFLTEKGSRGQDPDFGTRFVTEMRRANANDSFMQVTFRDAAEDVLDQQNLYRASDAPNDEILSDVELLSFTTPDASQLSLNIALTTLAGTSRTFTVPISLAIK